MLNKFSTILRQNNRIFHSFVNGRKRQSSSWNLLFFGSDEFSLKTLRALNEDYRNPNGSLKSLEVVTNLKSKPNPVHKYAMDENLPIYNWPPSLQKPYDIGVVVSFGHLIPGNIIDAFPLGMLNVHASILPRWRGAAPIIYAIANGDRETGVTIMRIKPKQFDVGEIIQQEFVSIPNDMKMPELYNNLSNLGATTLLSVIKKLPKRLDWVKEQSSKGITYAPRITPNLAIIHWENQSAKQIYDLSRALDSIYQLSTNWTNFPVKLQTISVCQSMENLYERPGFSWYDKTLKVIKTRCKNDTCLSISKLVVNRKSINAIDFNNGYVKKTALENRYFY